MCKFTVLFVVISGKQACRVPCICMCVKGVGDVASSCKGDRGDACLKACGLGQLPPHTITLCLPYFSNIPHFLPILSSFLSPPLYPTHPSPHIHTRTLWPLRKGEGRLMQLAPLWALLCWWIEVVWWATRLPTAVPALLGPWIYKQPKWRHNGYCSLMVIISIIHRFRGI